MKAKNERYCQYFY